MSDRFEFPNCMHALAAACHMQGINPQDVTISLPRDQWWKLQCAIERQYAGFMTYDGRQKVLDSFQYMGFKFRPDDASKVVAQPVGEVKA